MKVWSNYKKIKIWSRNSPTGPWRNPKIRDPKRPGLLCKEWPHNYLLFFGYKSFVTYMFANIVSQYMAYPLILLNSVFWWKKRLVFMKSIFTFFKFIVFNELRNICLLPCQKENGKYNFHYIFFQKLSSFSLYFRACSI